MRNKGRDSTTFLETEALEDTVEIAAKGRKGVFGFDSGNKTFVIICHVDDPIAIEASITP